MANPNFDDDGHDDHDPFDEDFITDPISFSEFIQSHPLPAASIEELDSPGTLQEQKTEDSSSRSKTDANFTTSDQAQDDYFIELSADDMKLLQDLNFFEEGPGPSSSIVRGNPAFQDSATQEGQSSRSLDDPAFICAICSEVNRGMCHFLSRSCAHACCNHCMVNYVDLELKKNVTTISCPHFFCRKTLAFELCGLILPKGMLDRWGNALCESVIPWSQRFYCPFKNCSELLINDGEKCGTECECPVCKRSFCTKCKVPWHSGVNCEEFQKFQEEDSDDLLLMELAESEGWKRCPDCRMYVEVIGGCSSVKCRCGTFFCYKCGKGNSKGHFCESGTFSLSQEDCSQIHRSGSTSTNY